ncbi:MAG: pdxH [Bacteroidetes bacterium]|jgi:pyridoxamine 5'-phosphate oxidase|nr:pdxH [Bacteroidota bacterium]MDF2450511.1 pdxH [Bacteroidota bacterium]
MSHVNQHISQLREDFMKSELSENGIQKSPDLQFEQWMKNAVESKVNEFQAFNLCTVSKEHKPSSRIVYLREFGDNLFYFYTNYNSKKAIEISLNKNVCLTFFWPELERQIRIEGTIEFAEKEKSDAYFNHRPLESRIGAWSSPQSNPIKDRNALEQLVEENTEKFKDQHIERPEFWGGYKITAHYYEFWQGRKSRLHDRIAFTLENNNWKIERLAP